MNDNLFTTFDTLDGSVLSCLETDAILKQFYSGDIFSNKPQKLRVVSYVDAESSTSGKTTEDNGIVTNFVCDRCKRTFKADKAKAIKIYLNEAHINEVELLYGYRYQRAYCGRCFKKTRKLTQKIYEAICEFESHEN